MTRRELGTLMKTAAEKSRRSHELYLLIKAAAYQVDRKQGLKNVIKSACGILEKSAAIRLNIGAGTSGLRPGAGRAFKVTAGTQNYLRNIHANARPAPRVRTRPTAPRRPNWFRRRFGYSEPYGFPSQYGGFWSNLSGRSGRRFMSNFENTTFREMANKGRQSLSSMERMGMGKDMASWDQQRLAALGRSQELLPRGFSTHDPAYVGAAQRQAARIARAQARARAGFGAAVGTTAAASIPIMAMYGSTRG